MIGEIDLKKYNKNKESKVITSVRISSDLLEKAKEKGINISQTLEEALRQKLNEQGPMIDEGAFREWCKLILHNCGCGNYRFNPVDYMNRIRINLDRWERNTKIPRARLEEIAKEEMDKALYSR